MTSRESDIPRLSSKEAEVLRLLTLQSAEMFGLQLVEQSAGELKRGTVYVTLGRMEDKGYVTSRREASSPEGSTIPRRLYKVTGHGARVFNAWQVASSHFAGAVA